MVIFQYNLYIFGIHLWTVFNPKPCYNELYYKEIVVYIIIYGGKAVFVTSLMPKSALSYVSTFGVKISIITLPIWVHISLYIMCALWSESVLLYEPLRLWLNSVDTELKVIAHADLSVRCSHITSTGSAGRI